MGRQGGEKKIGYFIYSIPLGHIVIFNTESGSNVLGKNNMF